MHSDLFEGGKVSMANNSFKENVLPKLSMGISKFSDNIYVSVIAQGMMATLPVTLVGSFMLILGGLSFIPEAIRTPLMLGSTVCSNLITIYVVVALAGIMGKKLGQNPITCAMIALASFFIVTPISVFEVGEKKVQAYSMELLGSKGMFVGMIISLFTIRLYCVLMNKRITLRMPDSVPKPIAANFEAIVPGSVVLISALLINIIFSLTSHGNIHQFIYTYLQLPLQSLGGSIWSALLLMFIAELLWFFGIHGSTVTNSILTALFATQAYANMEVVAAGGNPEFPINSFFLEVFKGPRAMALACVLLFICRSSRLKTIGKISIFPSIFGITEPMKFGIPMVFNPWILVPMTMSAVVSVAIAYIATMIGFLPIVSANISRMIPAPISGFLAAGWQGAVVQIIQFVVIVLLYLPFMKKVDQNDLDEQKKNGSEKQTV